MSETFDSWLTAFRRKKVLTENEIERLFRNDGMHKTLGVMSLTSLGIGSVVGAGIFVVTGQAAAKYAGPALALSFVVSSISCFFTGLCYAELSAAIPIAGSAYTYVYVTCGELAAWIVGQCLCMEYLFAASAVAVSWGAAVQALVGEIGLIVPAAIASAPVGVDEEGAFFLTGSVANVPSIAIIVCLTAVLSVGVQESARFNTAAVAVKLSILVGFVGFGIYYATQNPDRFSSNLSPFIPANTGKFGCFGVTGIFRGAGAIFFAYVGFDAIASVSQECRNPGRDVPRALLYTLVICAVLYVSVTIILTGLVKYTTLAVDAPVIAALHAVGAPSVFRVLVEVATVAGLTSVCLVSLLSMPRIAFAMSADGLLPKACGVIHSRFRTPLISTLWTGVVAALISGVFPLDVLGELVSFGTLIAFTFVCAGVALFRSAQPEIHRPFRIPFHPVVPVCGAVSCLVQLFSLPVATWRNCLFLLFLGTLCYIFFGRHRSVLGLSSGARRSDESSGRGRLASCAVDEDREEVAASAHEGGVIQDGEMEARLAARPERAVVGDRLRPEVRGLAGMCRVRFEGRRHDDVELPLPDASSADAAGAAEDAVASPTSATVLVRKT